MSMIEKLKALLGGNGDNGSGDDVAMISCEDALSLVHEFIDGELEQVPHASVKAHFDVCQKCYPHLRLEGAFREAVQRATEDEGAPPEVRAKLLEALAEAEG
jgi:anti-sigma factor (TIGR02949 family)